MITHTKIRIFFNKTSFKLIYLALSAIILAKKQPNSFPRGGQLRPESGGQYAPKSAGQYAPESGGQLAPEYW